MPWCPKCKTEYRDGFEECADCKVALVDELPEEEPLEASSLRQVPADQDPFADGEFSDEEQPVFLVGLEDAEETIRLSELLASCRVPAFPLHRTECEETAAESQGEPRVVDEWEEVGEDWCEEMMCTPMSAFEIYVPAFLYERALELLEEDEKVHQEEEEKEIEE